MDELVNASEASPDPTPIDDPAPAAPRDDLAEPSETTEPPEVIEPRRIEGPAAEPISPAGQRTRPWLKRLLPAVAGLAVLLIALRRRRA